MTLDITDCGFMNIRRIARIIGQFYDQRLGPTGHTTSQFILLAALDRMGPTALTPLAEFLEMDRTTLTRNLKVLQQQGLIETSRGEDARVRLNQISKSGKAALDQMYPAWETAQRAFVERLGEDQWPDLLQKLNYLAKRLRS